MGFIVTNLEADSRAVLRFYNKRGTAEQWIKEGRRAVRMTWLSCHRFRSNTKEIPAGQVAGHRCEPGGLARVAASSAVIVPSRG